MKRKSFKRIGVITGGGDCPGLNAVIRAVAKTAINDYGAHVIGYRDGYYGLIRNDIRHLDYKDVSGILTHGGTILGTSNIANPFRYPIERGGKVSFTDVSRRAVKHYKDSKLDALVIIGGDGTLSIAHKLSRLGINVIGVPKTIDNDVRGTDLTFGFISACTTATEGIDKLHTTAQSHHRVMIIEVMGRYAGWLALYSGVAGGGDIILIPEIPFNIGKICEVVKRRHERGNRFSIVVVSEGAKPKGGRLTIKKMVAKSTDTVRLGGIANLLAEEIEKKTRIESRATILGHLQRGGSPTPYDRVLATQLGTEAVHFIAKKRFDHMVALKGSDLVPYPLKKVINNQKLVPINHTLIKTARSIGTSFGD